MRVTTLFLTLVFSAVSFGQTTVPVESLNRTIQNRLNQPTGNTDNFEFKPLRILSEDAETRYIAAIEAQRPNAILEATNFLKRNASYKRSASESDRNIYKRWLERLQYRQSTNFRPKLTVMQEGAIGHPVSLKILQVMPDGLTRAEVGRDKHEVFIKGLYTNSNSDGAWANIEEEDEIVLEVSGQLSYATVLGNERTLPVLDVVDVAPFHERLAEATKRPSREARSATPTRYELREWTDATGKYKVRAVFAGLASGSVTLKKEDDSVMQIPLEKLSKGDNEYVESLRQ
ncbi:MAG: SHD1 domain-containing protein [Planctomycetota bacterium]|nr:SHD1 domain-containing protein [Planctomycetota bacterium]